MYSFHVLPFTWSPHHFPSLSDKHSQQELVGSLMTFADDIVFCLSRYFFESQTIASVPMNSVSINRKNQWAVLRGTWWLWEAWASNCDSAEKQLSLPHGLPSSLSCSMTAQVPSQTQDSVVPRRCSLCICYCNVLKSPSLLFSIIPLAVHSQEKHKYWIVLFNTQGDRWVWWHKDVIQTSREAKTRGPQVQGQSGQCSETLLRNKSE